ncbi:MAG: integrase [Cellvibrionaceae bacterium]|jgi:integrase
MVKHLQQLPDSKKKYRNIALVLTGFFGAFRRSELVAIQVNDLAWEPEGLIIPLPRSKGHRVSESPPLCGESSLLSGQSNKEMDGYR